MLLDAGGVYPTKGYSKRTAGIITRIAFEAMDYMNYQAVNLGLSDFKAGHDFLLNLQSITAFPIITSNLKYKSSGSTFGKKYVVKNVNGVRVGILGILSEDELNLISNRDIADLLTIVPPESILTSLIAEVQEKADVVILLSQLGYSATSQLLNKVSGIDLAVVGNNQKSELPKCGNKEHQQDYEKVNGTLIMPVCRLGQALGYVKISLDPLDKSVVNLEPKEIQLDMEVKPDSELEKISGPDIYVTAMKEIKKRVEKVRRELEQEFMRFREYTPEEYFKHILSEKNHEKNNNK